jgi:hypothetical protein
MFLNSKLQTKSLFERSSDSLNVFTKVLKDLELINSESEQEELILQDQIKNLTEESIQLNALRAKNSKVISKIKTIVE